ncbi:SGNH/GDSL hydrolase family protein [Microbacterium sp.]|uniref:SGNH/GDSL hydrolase family protein n=1 Tax=Microbacterium sp. TaxID=51671 RepID=UPI0028117A97|nr:SGNH/GDSL hydrolase family protein [Microbacterium sp.]
MSPTSPVLRAVALAQGMWVRRRIELLPAAAGPMTGIEGSGLASRALEIGILGESTAAGCGVAAHREGFAGALARSLSATAAAPVRWQVVGRHGATASRIRHRLLPRLDGAFDLVVVLAGANDVLSRRSDEEWRDDLTAIVEDLRERSRHVVVAGTPPFATFPTLPRTLGRYLAARGAELDEVSRQICDATPGARFAETDAGLVDASFFATDGFHPGAHGYERWADAVADVVPALV